MTSRLGLHEMHAGTGMTCPFCHMALGAAEPIWTCPTCSTRHHEECARDNRHCTVLGCQGRVPAAAASQASQPPRVTRTTSPRHGFDPERLVPWIVTTSFGIFMGTLLLSLAYPEATRAVFLSLPWRGGRLVENPYDVLLPFVAGVIMSVCWGIFATLALSYLGCRLERSTRRSIAG